MRSTLASLTKRPALFFFASLLLLELWGDFKGCSSTLDAFYEPLSDGLVNGRIWALVGIFGCAALFAIWPRFFQQRLPLLVKAVTAASVLLTVALLWKSHMTAMPTALAALLAVSVGFTYGVLVMAILHAISQSETSFFGVGVSLCLLLSQKALLLFILCALPAPIQAAILALLPAFSGLLCLRGLEDLSAVEGAATPAAPPKESLPLPFSGLLLFAPVLNAVIRAFSSLGAWSAHTSFELDLLPVGLGCVAVFVLAVAAVFRQRERSDYVDVFIAAIGCLFIGFFLTNGGILQGLDLPQAASAAFLDGLELFSGFTFWLSLIVMGRLMGKEGLRYIAVGQMTRNAVAVPLGIMLAISPSATQVIFPITAVTLAVALLAILSATLKQERTIAEATPPEETVEPNDDLATVCKRLAEERLLTARESEVLLLLAQGRSRPFIAKKLVVAESTIKTHTRHVYQKCGVANKQELISLLHEESHT